MLIQWSEKYCTGVDSIDDQHRELINQLNRLHEAITSSLGKEVISEILDFAGEYAVKHFAHEESCMDRYQCPVAAQNKQAHQKFIERFGEIREQLAKKEPDAASVLAVYKELRDWIHSHILKIDTNLKSCAQAHNK
jgi:hemerythrin